jgi:hypothetical protein
MITRVSQLLSIALMLGSTAFAQTKETLYYDENWKGLDEKKKAAFYRSVQFDVDEKPVGVIETYFKSGKLQSKGEAIYIDRLDGNKTVWKNNVTFYNAKGIKLFDQNYDDQGNAHGMQTAYNDNGVKISQGEYDHGNYSTDYYLVYDKDGNSKKYSYLTMMPMKIATTGKKIIPKTQMKVVYREGSPIQYYFIDGISVAVQFGRESSYGDYYVAYITIENGTDKEFDFDPSGIISVLAKDEKVDEAEILSYEEYMKKVNRRQAWTTAFTAFAEQQAASQAGYSASSTTGAVAGISTSTTNASGFAGNTYGAATSTTNSAGVVVGSSTTVNYNGAAQYAANQNAANNINALSNQQYQIKSSIKQGYLKKNTIYPSTRLIGYINIKYDKATGILLNIPVNGKMYQFGG